MKIPDVKDFTQIDRFLEFLNDNPSAEWIRDKVKQLALHKGFTYLSEKDEWHLKPDRSYILARGNTSIFFRLHKDYQKQPRARVLVNHVDSPTLKIRANPNNIQDDMLSAGVEIYGSPILQSWVDRDLCVAGEVFFQNDRFLLDSCLVNFKEPIARIPNLSIHLQENRSGNPTLDKQQHIKPIFLHFQPLDFYEILLSYIRKEYNIKAKKIFYSNLSFYDAQPAAFQGINSEFISSQRLDNVLSVFASLQACCSTSNNASSFLVLYDNEEIGSQTAFGGKSNLLWNLFRRIYKNDYESCVRMVQNSVALSLDCAHAYHPHFASHFDEQHKPKMNLGPIFKTSAKQQYATDYQLFSMLQSELELMKIPVQFYSGHNNFPGGSTLGPIIASQMGIRTIDIGAGIWSMHSIRETCGVKDIEYLIDMCNLFFSTPVFSELH